ncbi:endoribonuclease [Pseudidiomarina salinarum]|uniref:Endoribonuclease n=1 Tax=Pseudidiomarina salinarum TaxID=435908 RepID=A0A094L763_9GAMM|nr:RidA family protein [Pseudidiomarina salinarum]KFZ30608.1 endoribonuclease [Pseudidiomarina salinarum]RUO69121.1 RidA family protein [Pseudidiomarina salinarum]
MSKVIISTENAPAAIGPYSQAVKVGTTVYLSGQIPLVPGTMEFISDNFRDQAVQVFKNLKAVCEAAGGELQDMIKLQIYLTDLGQFAVVNEVMAEFFREPYPARAAIEVKGLPKGAQIEIDGVMELPSTD